MCLSKHLIHHPTNSAFGERVDRDVIYDVIISDLTFAKNNLDWATASSSPERVTQGAARALLMRVYLQRAGYSLQSNGQLKRRRKVSGWNISMQ